MQYQQSIEILKKLIGFDTTSHKSNLNLIDYAAENLKNVGFQLHHTYNSNKTKANLYASLGPKDKPGLVLSGHSDVVPAQASHWQSDPFALSERDGLLYGRGSCDMKGFLACCLQVAGRLQQEKLHTPLHLAFSYDEEVGCIGVGSLIEELNPNFAPPAKVWIGEPTCLIPINRHKGITLFSTQVRGKAAHSSKPHLGHNAIYTAMDWIELVRSQTQLWSTSSDQAVQERTCNVGEISGGQASNIVPNLCEFKWDLRLWGEDKLTAQEFIEGLNLKFHRSEQNCQISHSIPVDSPGLTALQNESLGKEFCELTGAEQCESVTYMTEAGLFEKAGFSTIVCGPGSIDQAHQVNEFVSIEQIKRCTELIESYVMQNCGGV